MLENLKDALREFKDAAPGKRFQRIHKRRQRSRSSSLKKVLVMAVGVLIMAAGIVMLGAPGPGILVLLLGAGITAQESQHVAKALDKAEWKLWLLADRGQKLWKRLRLPGQILIVLIVLALFAAASFAAYQFFFGG